VRIAITDVAYFDDVAFAACVLADRWEAQFPADSRVILRTPVEEYVPGAFWQRELPCLLAVLDGMKPDVVVVDGYVWLDDAGRMGLGAHLHERLGLHARHVMRGNSRKPLYVTSVGMGLDEAAAAVLSMHGPHRLPTLVTLADHLARAGRTT
jgi:deoxyribonuclease V